MISRSIGLPAQITFALASRIYLTLAIIPSRARFFSRYSVVWMSITTKPILLLTSSNAQAITPGPAPIITTIALGFSFAHAPNQSNSSFVAYQDSVFISLAFIFYLL